MRDLHLAGTTVTLFGEHDGLDRAVGAELDQYGCSTHSVTVAMGWFSSAARAVVRLDTTTGMEALQDLARGELPAAHVVAVCESTAGRDLSRQIERLCRQCGERHDVHLIWHPPFESTLTDDADVLTPSSVPDPRALAAMIADQFARHDPGPNTPSFTAETFVPPRHRGDSH